MNDTPMQYLKDRFSKFKALLPEGTRDVALNKSSAKTREILGFCAMGESYENKGVKSDFIRLFQVGDVSMGFSFSFLDVPKEKWTVRVSVKMGDGVADFHAATSMTVDEFSERFDAFLSDFSEESPSVEAAIADAFGFDLSKRKLSKSEKRKEKKRLSA